MAIVPDMVGIVVSDMGRSLAFYRMLGLDIAEGQDGEEYVQVITPNGYRISWNVASMMQGIHPGWSPTPPAQRDNWVSLAFLCDSPAEVDETVARIAASGLGHVIKEPWDAFWGQRYAMIADPDGNEVDVAAAL